MHLITCLSNQFLNEWFWFTIHYCLFLHLLMQHVHLGPSKHLKGTSSVSSVPSTAAPPTRVQPTVCAAADTTVRTLTLYRCPVPVCHSLMLFYVICGVFLKIRQALMWSTQTSSQFWLSSKHSEIGFSQYRW